MIFKRGKITSTLLPLLLGFSLFLPACESSDPNLAFDKGSIVADFTLPDIKGEPVNFKKSRGTGKTYLLFWSSSCISCKEGMTVLEKVYRKSKGQGFSIVAVNVYQDRETINKFIAELGLTYHVLLDKSGDVAAAYDVYAVPVAYVIDADGALLDKFMGEMTKENVEAIINKYWPLRAVAQSAFMPATPSTY